MSDGLKWSAGILPPATRWLVSIGCMWGIICLPAGAQPLEVLALSASSTAGMLMDATDGDLQTSWKNQQAGEREAWLAARLGKSSVATGVRLALGTALPDTRILIEVSPEGERYAPVLTIKADKTDGMKTYTFAKNLPALYVRVRFQFVGGGDAPQFSLAEFEAIGL